MTDNAIISKTKPLTIQQEKFCLEYLQSGHVGQAAMAVGVSPVSGSRWKADPVIKARIQELLAEAKDWKIMTATDRRVQLSGQARGEIPTSLEVSKNKSGKVTHTAESYNRIAPLDLLNKMDHLYTPDASQVVNNTQVVFVIGKGYAQQPGQKELTDGKQAQP